MIVVRVKAGLGNQLFQYATGLRLASRHKTTVRLDLEEYRRETHRTPGWLPGYERKVLLDQFQISGVPASATEAGKYRDRFRFSNSTPLARGARLVRRVYPRFCFPASHVRENGSSFDASILQLPDNSYLEGFWQSEKYFLDAAEKVRAEFTARDPGLARDARDYLGGLRSGGRKVISIHIRRGDLVYAKEVLNDSKVVHGEPVGVQYVQAAMKRFPENSVFLIFSDSARDIGWCRENIRGENLAFSEGRTDLQDFALMRECDHNIIANSTFSWWAAWLNANPGRRVIAPRKWFHGGTNGHSTDGDIVPESWERL